MPDRNALAAHVDRLARDHAEAVAVADANRRAAFVARRSTNAEALEAINAAAKRSPRVRGILDAATDAAGAVTWPAVLSARRAARDELSATDAVAAGEKAAPAVTVLAETVEPPAELAAADPTVPASYDRDTAAAWAALGAEPRPVVVDPPSLGAQARPSLAVLPGGRPVDDAGDDATIDRFLDAAAAAAPLLERRRAAARPALTVVSDAADGRL